MKDAGVEFEQHLAALPLAIVVIRAKTNRLHDIRPVVPRILAALSSLTPNTLIQVG